MSALFPGFERRQIAVSGATINLVHGGQGPALLLLHGYPQTHCIWHKIAPRLAQNYTVVAPDLRGYGDSSKPAGLPDHSNYSKRALALDQVEVMQALGYPEFHLVGHDRGARVAHRLALDHPERVKKLVVLDICPTRSMYARTDRAFAKAYFHWFLLIQPAPFPETLIGADPEFFIKYQMGRRYGGLKAFAPEAMAEYLRCFSDPAAIHASCEDYRAAESIDLEHDSADEASRLSCPVLALWGRHGVIEQQFDCLAEWRALAREVHGEALDCGHYLPEERPEEVARQLESFLA
ncbi:MAG TPA: alpha/beta hydrolase [Burkholderiales bacterium]|nr:alpha/beta hydrolase [Burkholderiales bacterium]